MIRFVIAFIFLIHYLLPVGLMAQGFVSFHNHVPNKVLQMYAHPYGNGYTVNLNYKDPLIENRFCKGNLTLDSTGNSISWDSTVLQASSDYSIFWLLPDNNYLYFNPATTGSTFEASKVSPNGNIIWTVNLTKTSTYQIINKVQTNDQGDVFVFWRDAVNPVTNLGDQFLAKITPGGNLAYQLNTNLPTGQYFNTSTNILALYDGTCLMYRSAYDALNNMMYRELTKLDGSGNFLWAQPVNFFTNLLVESSEHKIYCCSILVDSLNNTISTIYKFSAEGNLEWAHNFEPTIPIVYSEVTFLNADHDGGVWLGGMYRQTHNQGNQNVVARYSSDGTQLFSNHYSNLSNNWSWFSLQHATAVLPDNTLLLGLKNEQNHLVMVKITPGGQLFPGKITGKLALDNNVNCLVDTLEVGLTNWKVTIDDSLSSLYSVTDSTGAYAFNSLPVGTYNLSIAPPSYAWEACPPDLSVVLGDTTISLENQDFNITPAFDCPLMTVDVVTNRLRRCLPSNYTVQYCNNGTTAAENAFVTLVLDPLIHVNNASIPFTQHGDTLDFSIGQVNSLECGTFSVNVIVDCDSSQLGQTLCVEAAIYPDTFCVNSANWSGATIQLKGNCLNDSIVTFSVRNIGLAPSAMLDYVVVDDHVITLQGSFASIAPNQMMQLYAQPANGHTLRLICNQEPNHPGLEMPSVAIEGCGFDLNGNFSTGMLLQLPNADGNPFTDIDCHEIVGSFDPNDKTAFPQGIGNEHFIESNTFIEYLIRFQNTGTDTAFNIVLRDTIDTNLDPATIQPGASSHAYNWSMEGSGILKFTFSNILLPDSNINEPSSHGFVQFLIRQKPDLQDGIVINNRAGIYFDFNPVVLTNTVFHTIGKDFLTTGGAAPPNTPKQAWLTLAPSPAHDYTMMTLDREPGEDMEIIIRDIMGVEHYRQKVQGKQTKLLRVGMPAGIYWMELIHKESILATNKLIWLN